jgi:hypothetical protein
MCSKLLSQHAGNGEIFHGPLGLDAVIDGSSGSSLSPRESCSVRTPCDQFDRAFNAGQLFGYDMRRRSLMRREVRATMR